MLTTTPGPAMAAVEARTASVAAVRVRVATRGRYPRWSSSAPSGSSAGSKPTGPATQRFAASPRSAYHRSTSSTAASSGRPGEPTVATEFARLVNPRDARSTQSPSRAVSIAGQAPTITRCRSSVDSARCGAPRRDGRGGTSRTTSTVARSTRTSPARVETTRASSSTATRLTDDVGEPGAGAQVGRGQPVAHDHPGPGLRDPAGGPSARSCRGGPDLRSSALMARIVWAP